MDAILPEHPRNCILSCGLVIDGPGEGTRFPSAGGNSSDPRVQAIYWRCLTVFFASARITNPDIRLVFFTNADLPVVDGVAIAEVLDRYAVEVRIVALSARLGPNRPSSWGNVLYFLDMMGELAQEPPETRIAITDCDVVVCAGLSRLFALLDEADFGAYEVDATRPDEDINGVSRNELGRIAMTLWHGQIGRNEASPPHFGGELFMTTPRGWSQYGPLFKDLLDRMLAAEPEVAGVTTEEHLFSLVFQRPEIRVASANGLIKRMWTSPRHNTVRPGDERMALWHLPAEKRYGFHDLFADLAAARFPRDIEPARMRAMAGLRAGVPAKSIGKVWRDGVRQVSAKLGLRT